MERHLSTGVATIVALMAANRAVASAAAAPGPTGATLASPSPAGSSPAITVRSNLAIGHLGRRLSPWVSPQALSTEPPA